MKILSISFSWLVFVGPLQCLSFHAFTHLRSSKASYEEAFSIPLSVGHRQSEVESDGYTYKPEIQEMTEDTAESIRTGQPSRWMVMRDVRSETKTRVVISVLHLCFSCLVSMD